MTDPLTHPSKRSRYPCGRTEKGYSDLPHISILRLSRLIFVALQRACASPRVDHATEVYIIDLGYTLSHGATGSSVTKIFECRQEFTIPGHKHAF